MAVFLLIQAAYEGKLEAVRRFLREGIDVNEVNQNGSTALIFASMNGHLEIVSLLIDYGAEINRRNKFGWTAVYCASAKNQIQIVSLLIEKGADINIPNNTLHSRSQLCGETIQLCLSSYGTELISLLDHDGRTALDIAREEKKSDCVALLEKYEHFHRYRVTWLSFSTSVRSYQEDKNQESKQNQNQESKQIKSHSMMRMMDSSDLVRYVTEYM